MNANEVEMQFLPFIFLYKDLKKYLGKDKAVEVGGEIIARCGALDINLTIPKLRSNERMKDYINYLKNSKYFKYSDYNIIEESEDEVRIKVTKCIYCELFKKYEIFELAPYLCKSDEIFFSTYHPKIELILRRTIARGSKFCDEVYRWDEKN
jgi:hypothetical protein